MVQTIFVLGIFSPSADQDQAPAPILPSPIVGDDKSQCRRMSSLAKIVEGGLSATNFSLKKLLADKIGQIPLSSGKRPS
jgi:hypothetical protein